MAYRAQNLPKTVKERKCLVLPPLFYTSKRLSLLPFTFLLFLLLRRFFLHPIFTLPFCFTVFFAPPPSYCTSVLLFIILSVVALFCSFFLFQFLSVPSPSCFNLFDVPPPSCFNLSYVPPPSCFHSSLFLFPILIRSCSSFLFRILSLPLLPVLIPFCSSFVLIPFSSSLFYFGCCCSILFRFLFLFLFPVLINFCYSFLFYFFSFLF